MWMSFQTLSGNFGHISDFLAHHNMVITPPKKPERYGGWIDRANGSLKLLKFDPEKQRLEYLDKVILRDPGVKVAGQTVALTPGSSPAPATFTWVRSPIPCCSGLIRIGEFELVGQLAKGAASSADEADEDGIIWLARIIPTCA